MSGYPQYDVEERPNDYLVPSDPMDDLQCDSCQ